MIKIKYAVLEWDKGDDDSEYVRVLSTDVDRKIALWYLDICPDKFTREIITMDKYRIMTEETVV